MNTREVAGSEINQPDKKMVANWMLKHSGKFYFALRSTALSVLLCLTPAVLHAQWTVTYLGRGGIANAAWGNSQGGALSNATLWTGTEVSQVSLHPPGFGMSEILGMHEDQQVGYVSDQIQQASLWSGTADSWISLHPPESTASRANAVWGNQQVGWAAIDEHLRASLWNGSALSRVDLTPAWATDSEAAGVWENQQVGTASNEFRSTAVRWAGTAATAIELNPVGADYSSATGIFENQIVGVARVGGVSHASLWTGGATTWVDLHPQTATYSYALATDGSRQVGIVKIGNTERASLWSGSQGTWVDLSSFLSGSWTSSTANAIWSDGTTTRIVGYGIRNGQFEALLWESVPARRIAGKIVAGDFSGSYASKSWSVRVSQGSNSVNLNVLTDASGNYSFPTAFVGPVDVSIRGTNWLSKKTTGVTTTMPNVNLLNGDVVPDEVIDLSDYTIIATYFNAIASDANWNTVGANGYSPRQADITGDGVVDLTDYTAIAVNFNALGN